MEKLIGIVGIEFGSIVDKSDVTTNNFNYYDFNNLFLLYVGSYLCK